MGTRVKNLRGQTFGLLTVISFAHADVRGRSLWFCQCTCGNTTIVAGRNLHTGDTVTCGDRKEHPIRRGSVGYRQAHRLLARERGKASEHLCVDCNEQAHDWSYEEPTGFSTDQGKYVPRCRRDHHAYDHKNLVSA